MRQKKTKKRSCSTGRLTLNPLFLLLFSVFLTLQGAGAQDSQVNENPAFHRLRITESDPGIEKTTDDLCSINAIRRFLAGKIRYPEAAAEAGQSGTVELYARVNNQGLINEILELQPVRDFIEVNEIVISAAAPVGKEITVSSRHASLVAESRRVLMALPRCDIQEIFGQTLKFTFKFVLQ